MYKKIKTRILERGALNVKMLIKVLQEHENKLAAIEQSEGGEILDIGNLKETVGDADSGLVKDVADLKTGKANANHTHTLNKISDVTTVEAVVTYADESTETLLLVKQVVQE